MTCREKLKSEHPEFISPSYFGECYNCPFNYGYLPRSKCLCGGNYSEFNRETCTKCWDQEIEEPAKEAKYAIYAKHLRMKYEALIETGFSEDQAMQLIPMWFDD